MELLQIYKMLIEIVSHDAGCLLPQQFLMDAFLARFQDVAHQSSDRRLYLGMATFALTFFDEAGKGLENS